MSLKTQNEKEVEHAILQLLPSMHFDLINGDKIEVLPVGCDTDAFIFYNKDDPKILAVRESLGGFA